ncbi:hypothetical protein SLEP1_g25966 [Rubroshorea leprosula]|uniref:DC1 domain-containing protein n=1 Tax=Rubroshorea leprosula TaxID=152421 RepID=A0AAV5JUX8_9ROSI|nr:hypothetical protein SLEP1_g25966 [Rubroshorea leprosula]
MELNHFSHSHPMLLVEDKSYQVKEAYCSRCRELIWDSSYTCANCKFFLQRRRAELHREGFGYPFHHQHPLVLYDKPQYNSSCVAFKCNSCGKQKVYWDLFYLVVYIPPNLMPVLVEFLWISMAIKVERE